MTSQRWPVPGLGQAPRLIGLVLLVALTAACNLDRERQYDLRFPATLSMENRTDGPLEVSAVFSTPESASTFSLRGGSIAPGGSLRLRISEDVYQDILAGNFAVRAACAGRPDWDVTGQELERRTVDDPETWLVAVALVDCAP